MARLGGYFRGLGKGRGRCGSIRGTLEDCGVGKREAWLD